MHAAPQGRKRKSAAAANGPDLQALQATATIAEARNVSTLLMSCFDPLRRWHRCDEHSSQVWSQSIHTALKMKYSQQEFYTKRGSSN